MRKIIFVCVLVIFSNIAKAEQSWWDSLKSSLGFGSDSKQEEQVSNVNGLIDYLSNELGVSKEQAQGGTAAVMNFLKDTISSEKFSELSEKLPGVDSVLQYVPDISAAEGGLGGLLDKAASLNENLASLNELKKQFDALGLDTSMLLDYVDKAKAYFKNTDNSELETLLSDSFADLI